MAKMMENGKKFRQVHSTCWCREAREKDCTASSVGVQVLSTVPVMFAYWAKPEDTLDLARYLNDHIAQTVAEDPSRFVGLGSLPLQAPHLAVQELRRCVLDLGLCGVQIGTSVNDWALDAPELDPFYQVFFFFLFLFLFFFFFFTLLFFFVYDLSLSSSLLNPTCSYPSACPTPIQTLNHQECERLNVPIFIHPWNMQSEGRMGKYWFPWLASII